MSVAITDERSRGSLRTEDGSRRAAATLASDADSPKQQRQLAWSRRGRRPLSRGAGTLGCDIDAMFVWVGGPPCLNDSW